MKQAAIFPSNTASPLRESGAGGAYKAMVPAALLLIAGLGALAWASAAGGGTGSYAVIAPPGSTLADGINIVRAADGRLVQPGRFANIVIARSDRTDFPDALRRAGAWAVIDAPSPGGCLAPLVEDRPS